MLVNVVPFETAAAYQQGFKGYDIVSVKPSKSTTGHWSINARAATLQAENMPLTMLVANAYGVRESQVSGLPDWAKRAAYDINAKVLDPAPGLDERKLSVEDSNSEYRAKLQSILRDRFGIQAHQETKIAPVYVLSIVKSGATLKETPKESARRGIMTTFNHHEVKAEGVPIANLVLMLTDETSRNVIDKTALTGEYDFDLKWTPDDARLAPSDNAAAADPPPGLFSALIEQLGLKLTPDKAPVTMLLVDRIEMPEAN